MDFVPDAKHCFSSRKQACFEAGLSRHSNACVDLHTAALDPISVLSLILIILQDVNHTLGLFDYWSRVRFNYSRYFFKLI